MSVTIQKIAVHFIILLKKMLNSFDLCLFFLSFKLKMRDKTGIKSLKKLIMLKMAYATGLYVTSPQELYVIFRTSNFEFLEAAPTFWNFGDCMM